MINEVEVLEKVGQKIESPDRWCQESLLRRTRMDTQLDGIPRM